MLRHLKRVFISFSPLDPKATSARELLQRVGCDAARKSNPACAVDFAVNEAAPPGGAFVELQFVDDATAKLPTADFRVDDIVRIIEQKVGRARARAAARCCSQSIQTGTPAAAPCCLTQACERC